MADLSGAGLAALFLKATWPTPVEPKWQIVTASDALELFWSKAKEMAEFGQANGADWTPAAVGEVDALLYAMARSGEPQFNMNFSPSAVTEFCRRWMWSITALLLEKEVGHWSCRVPEEMSPEFQGTLVMLFVLGGPGKDYPQGFFCKRTETAQRSGH